MSYLIYDEELVKTKERRSTGGFLILIGLVFIGIAPVLAEIAISNFSPGINYSSLAMDNNRSNYAELNNSSVVDNEVIKAAMLKLPLSFIENRGQSPEDVKYMVKTGGQTVFFTRSEAIFALSRGNNSSAIHMAFEGSKSGQITGEQQLLGSANFFIGNESSKWINDIPTYNAIRYRELYSGVDLVFKGTEGYLKHELVLSPGADPYQIVLAYKGHDNLSLAEDGSLLIRTATGTLTDSAPLCYQEINGTKMIVEGQYSLSKEQKVGFKIGNYDKEYPLVIDPSLVYSTYFGGYSEDGYGITVDSDGNAYITGDTGSSNFPIQNPYQSANAGDYDAFVSKLSPDGNTLVYSTYLGGSDRDSGTDIAVDSSGNAYITGFTESMNFPTQYPYQTANAGYSDAFIAKLSPSGNSLVYSTYLGGSMGSDSGSPTGDSGEGIAVDDSGYAYVAGWTFSDDFPTQNPYQAANQGNYDAFVTKLSPEGNTLVYSTYLGGSDGDVAQDITLDRSGNAFITGKAGSGFPIQDPYQATNNAGSYDAFITKLSPIGDTLVYSTYLGGSGSEDARGIAVDSSGNAYITGLTGSADFPTQNPYQAASTGPFDAFVAKLSR